MLLELEESSCFDRDLWILQEPPCDPICLTLEGVGRKVPRSDRTEPVESRAALGNLLFLPLVIATSAIAREGLEPVWRADSRGGSPGGG